MEVEARLNAGELILGSAGLRSLDLNPDWIRGTTRLFRIGKRGFSPASADARCHVSASCLPIALLIECRHSMMRASPLPVQPFISSSDQGWESIPSCQ